jgi:signal transduction histidine kinase
MMKFFTPKKLPERVTLIWALMSIPVLAIALFSVTAIARFPQFTNELKYYWEVGEKFDEINRLMANAKIDREMLNSMRQAKPSEGIQDHVVALRAKVSDFTINQPFPELKDLTNLLSEQVTQLEDSVLELANAHGPLFGSVLYQKVEQLRRDSTTVLDPTFIQKVNEISDIVQVFSCSSRLTASRLLREDVDILLDRLAMASLPTNMRIQVHSNANAVRSEFAATLLACQDLERSFERAVAAFEQTNQLVSQLNLKVNLSIMATLESRLRSETTNMFVLFGAVVVTFSTAYVVTYVLSRRFGFQLASMTHAIRGVAKNERDLTIPFVGTDDEFGELAANVVTFQQNAHKLQDAMEQARQASDAKTRFLATVSHELRTPLNAILGFSEMIQHGMLGPVSAKYREYGSDINQSAQVLLEQISQILDLSRIESGQIDVHPEPTSVDEIVAIAIKRLEGRANAKELRITVQKSPVQQVLFDRRHLYQVVSNILDNAVKYNVHGGGIDVLMSRKGTQLSICFSDTGVGMEPDEAERAQEPFVQIIRTVDSLQGVGLGLSIVRRLVDANKSSLVILSEPGKGTAVTIFLPLLPYTLETAVA